MSSLHRCCLALVLVSPLAAWPARASQTTAPSQRASPEVEGKVAKLDDLLERVRTEFELPAIAAAITSGSELLALGAVGERERGGGVAVTTDDLWHLGSCTKAMTATLAARLVESGKVKWSTTAADVFSGGKIEMHAAWRDVPLEWFLQNRAGAPGNPPSDLWRALWKRDEAEHEARRWFVEQLLALEPSAPPGTKFIYSNQGFTIAGAMLERATKKTWEQLMRDELFTPLGMTSAGFGPPGSAKTVDQPRGHTTEVIRPGPAADNPAAIGPAGTVHCSMRDWAKFAAAHLRAGRGEKPFLKPETFAMLHTAPAGQDYAMGWGTRQRGWAKGDALSHAGSNTMWYCVVWIAPSVDRALLVATNVAGEKAEQGCEAALKAMLEHQGLK